MKTPLRLTLLSIISFIPILFATNTLKAQTGLGKFSYGDNFSNNLGYGICTTRDGGLAITGEEWDFTKSLTDEHAYLFKLDSNRNIVWSKLIGSSGFDTEGDAIVESRDGGLVVAGLSDPCFISKFDASGNLLWKKNLHYITPRSIIQTTDNGFALAGYTEFNTDFNKVVVVKCDSTGTVEWSKSIGGDYDDFGYSIVQTFDSGYAICGFTDSYGKYFDALYSDVYVIKLDSKGNLKWTKTIGGTSNDEGFAMIQTRDKGLVITGFTASFTSNQDNYLIKLDSAGNLLWTRLIDLGIGYGITETADGGLVVSGRGNSVKYKQGDLFIYKLNNQLNLEWGKIYKDIGIQYGNMVQTKAGGFAITGSLYFDTGHVMLLSMDSFGNLCDHGIDTGAIDGINMGEVSAGAIIYVGVTETNGSTDVINYGSEWEVCTPLATTVNDVSKNNQLMVYPNPFSTSSLIKTERNLANATLKIFDVTGREVRLLKNISGSEITLQRGDLTAGLYLLKLQDKNGVIINAKVVIE